MMKKLSYVTKKDITFINNCPCGFLMIINVSLTCKLKNYCRSNIFNSIGCFLVKKKLIN